MILCDRVGDRLKQHRLSGSRGRYDQSTLAFSNGREQIEDAGGQVVLGGFQLETIVGIQRSQVVEEDLVSSFVRMFEVHGFDLDQGEVPLAILRRTDLSRHGVPGSQIEFADLGRRYVDIVRSRQVVVIGRAEESESVRQGFKNAFTENEAALFGLRLQDLENQFLLPHSGSSLNIEVLGNLRQRGDVHFL